MPFLTLPDFERHYAVLRTELIGRARMLLPSWDEAEDAAQECFIAGHTVAVRGDVEVRDVRLWLRGVLDNCCAAMRRERHRQTLLTEATFQKLEGDGTGQRADRYDALVSALILSDMPSRQKRAVRMRLDGHNYKEIGAALDRPVSHVAARAMILAGLARLKSSPCTAFLAAELDAPQWKGQRVVNYRAPITTGAALARESLARLR